MDSSRGVCQEADSRELSPYSSKSVRGGEVPTRNILSERVIEGSGQSEKAAKPISDVRCSADYRIALVEDCSRCIKATGTLTFLKEALFQPFP
jgi:hypothetical protein